MHSGEQGEARWTSQVCLDKVGKQHQVVPAIPRQARCSVSRQVQWATSFILARR